ncbi:aminotransferase class IV [Arthrobacter sp. NPDC090010]|uniref:aminotransferase class IV n=1 Tax=Arthrobacter sp. NPDC090010 TaxID=3363942 RepID=UPI003810C52F
MTLSTFHLNGRTATPADLAPLAFASHAHFTAMQIRDQTVKGLDLHLARLRQASEVLFGTRISEDRIRRYLRRALERTMSDDASLNCQLFVRARPYGAAPAASAIEVLIKITDPTTAPKGPLTLDVVQHERFLPSIKHVGEVAKTLFLEQARADGFDDALFEDRFGRLSEATIWNIAFWDGHSVIWPEAAKLPGVTMLILQRRLNALGVPQQTREIRRTDVGKHLSGALMNSWTPSVPVSHIAGQSLRRDPLFYEVLQTAYAAEPSRKP